MINISMTPPVEPIDFTQLKADLNSHINAKITEVKNQLASDTSDLDAAVSNIVESDDLSASEESIKTHVTTKTSNIESQLTTLADNSVELFRFLEFSSVNKIAIQLSNDAEPITMGSSSFYSGINDYYGSSVAMVSVGQWYDVCHVTSMRGSLTGFLSMYQEIGNTFDIKITIDNVEYMSKTVTVSDLGNLAYVSCLKLNSATDTEVILENAVTAHTRAAGIKFNSSLRVEIRANNYLSSSATKRNACALYYAEPIL